MRQENKEYYQNGHPFDYKKTEDGKNYVDWKTVRNDTLNLSDGNDKVGTVACFNLPIVYTCDHRCECYKKGKCYACGGCYEFASNQATYSENLVYWKTHTVKQFVDEIVKQMTTNYKNIHLYRWFTCGDIISSPFFIAMVETAKRLPNVQFWVYTKKYHIVNKWCDEFGVENIPSNLHIIFSHWLNEDGSYFPMNNPYNFPTSEFIPLGKEELAEQVTHICPCSDPNVLVKCQNCEHACYTLTFNQSMALLEHSTAATRKRDKEVKEAHKKLKAANKGKKKNNKVA